MDSLHIMSTPSVFNKTSIFLLVYLENIAFQIYAILVTTLVLLCVMINIRIIKCSHVIIK